VLQGDFEAVGMFLARNVDPDKTGSCKGDQGVMNRSSTSSYNLGMGPKGAGQHMKGAAFEAAHRWGEGYSHVKIVHSLLANGEFTDLAQLLYVARSRHVYIELVVETLFVVYSIRVAS
jgi:hypothetical protein